MRRTILVMVFALFSICGHAQTGAVQSHCFLGGTQAITSGLKSSSFANGIIPSCKVTVYETGTQVLATLYANSTGTPLSNPFTANTLGAVNPGGWIFWAATNQGLDVVMSGGISPNTYPQPVTLVDVFPTQSFSPVSGVASIIGSSPIAVNNLFNVACNSGTCTVSCPTCSGQGSLALQMTPPVSGQFVVLFPNSVTAGGNYTCTGGTPAGSALASATSPFSQSVQRTDSNPTNCPSVIQNISNTTTLTAGISPSSVTAIYGGFVSTTQCAVNNTNNCGIWTETVNGITAKPGSDSWPLTTSTTLLCSGSCASFNYAGVQWIESNQSTLTWIGNPPYGGSGTFQPVLFVYYTGTPVTPSNQVIVQPCLNYNQGFLSIPLPCNIGIDGGTSTAFAANNPSFPGPLMPGTVVELYPAHNNSTTTPTFNFNSNGAIAITGPNGGSIVANDIEETPTSHVATLIFDLDGTWHLMNPQVSGSTNAITALTGDVTATGPGSVAGTLATVNSSPGTCGDSTHVCQVTTNGKGLVTAQSAVAITGGGGSVSTSANIYAANSQVQADSLVSTPANGLDSFGDSITLGTGATTSYPTLIGTDIGATVNNQGVGGDNAGDMVWHIFTILNPSDENNPIVTSNIGRNDVNGGATVGTFSKYQYASAAWTAVSSTNKILAGNAAVTATGTWSNDTTWANANGKTSSTASNTLSYGCQIGPSQVFYIWYKMDSVTGTFTVAVDGVTQTDTVGGVSPVSTNWSGDVPVHQSAAVGLARFTGVSQGSHTCLITVASGTVTILGFGFPPVTRYRGLSAPRDFLSGIVPEQNNGQGTADAPFNAASLAVSQALVADGLYVPFVDVNKAVDYDLDFASSPTQNCPAGTQLPLHPNQCGQQHLAQVFEANINAAPSGTVDVNGASVASPNFNGTTPAAGSGNTNVTWQVSGPNVSAEVPNYTGTSPIVVTGQSISCPTCSTGTGTSTSVNGGAALGTLNLNATTPAAPGGDTNCTWQISGSNASCYVPTSGGGFTAAPPYLETGGNFYLGDGYKVTKPPTSPTWLGSTGAPSTVTTGTNGNLILITGSVSTSYYQTQTATTSVEGVFQTFSQNHTGGDSDNAGIWIWDSTHNTIYIVNVLQTIASNFASYAVCAQSASYSGSGNPGTPSVIACFGGGAYGYGYPAHFKLSVSAGTLSFQISLDGGSDFTTIDSVSVGTISSGGFTLGPTGSPLTANVLSLAVN